MSIDSLPLDIINNIFQYLLPLPDRSNALLVCKNWLKSKDLMYILIYL